MATTIDKTDHEFEYDKESPAGAPAKQKGISKLALAMSLLLGVYFGIVLTKSEVVRWQRIHDMFLFNEPHMYWVNVWP